MTAKTSDPVPREELELRGLQTVAEPGVSPSPATEPHKVEGRPETEVPSAAASMNEIGHLSSDRLPPLDPALMSKTATWETLEMAWRSMPNEQRATAPGIDGLDYEQSYAWWQRHAEQILTALRNGRYQPFPVRRVEIFKASGGTRPLGIPTFMDRVIQRAIQKEVDPVLDPAFAESSFGFRRGRSVHTAAEHVLESVRAGYIWAVKVDLAKFFDTVDHGCLMAKLKGITSDQNLLSLLFRYLTAGVCIKGIWHPTTMGVPQGGPLSPLLANVVLHSLDKWLERHGHTYARYADDFIVLVKSRKAAKRVMQRTALYLERELKLTVNRTKSKIQSARNGIEFLGLCISMRGITIPKESIDKLTGYARALDKRRGRYPVEEWVGKAQSMISGWMAHYGRYMSKHDIRQVCRAMAQLRPAPETVRDDGGHVCTRPTMLQIWNEVLHGKPASHYQARAAGRETASDSLASAPYPPTGRSDVTEGRPTA